MTRPFLAVDAATSRGSVAIVDAGHVLAEGAVHMRGSDAERLMPGVADVLTAVGMRMRDVGGIVCGSGPGSFTSLRIAAAIAKGLAASSSVPLFTVSSLLLVVAGVTPRPPAGRYLAVLDAMREEVFASRISVSPEGQVEGDDRFHLLPAGAAARMASDEGRQLVGPACDPSWWPHARGAAQLRIPSDAVSPTELATWEPTYGRLAQAQVQWEQTHGRSLSA